MVWDIKAPSFLYYWDVSPCPFCVLQGSTESVDSCKVCGGHDDEEEEAGCNDSTVINGDTSCRCQNDSKQGKDTHKTSSDLSKLSGCSRNLEP